MKLIVLFISINAAYADGLFCGVGEHLSEHGTECLSCVKNETYIDIDHHQNTQCYRCTKLGSHRAEYIVEDCTPTQDTVFGCKPLGGQQYFWKPSSDHHLLKGDCTICLLCNYTRDTPYEGQKCGPDTDTVCCKEPNMKIVNGKCERRQGFTTTTETTTTIETTAETPIHSLTTAFSADVNVTTARPPQGEGEHVAIIIVAVILFVIGLVVAVAILYVKRKKIMTWWRARKSESAGPAEDPFL